MVVALLKIDKVVSYGAVYKNFIEISGLVVLTTGPLDFCIWPSDWRCQGDMPLVLLKKQRNDGSKRNITENVESRDSFP